MREHAEHNNDEKGKTYMEKNKIDVKDSIYEK